jgi:hypothetical protein
MDVKIKLAIKGVEIELSKEEAKELRQLLSDLTGEEKSNPTFIPYPYPIKEYYPLWPKPMIWEIGWQYNTSTNISAPRETVCLSLN